LPVVQFDVHRVIDFIQISPLLVYAPGFDVTNGIQTTAAARAVSPARVALLRCFGVRHAVSTINATTVTQRAISEVRDALSTHARSTVTNRIVRHPLCRISNTKGNPAAMDIPRLFICEKGPARILLPRSALVSAID